MVGITGYSVVIPSLAPGTTVGPVSVGNFARGTSVVGVTIVTTARVAPCGSMCHAE